jgi:ankyrin repeat protein
MNFAPIDLRSIITCFRSLLVAVVLLFVTSVEYSRAEPEAPFPLVASQTSAPQRAEEIQARKDRIQNFFEAIARGDAAAVSLALQEHPELLRSHDRYGAMPLNQAVSSNQLGIVRLLLDKGADPNGSVPGRYAINESIYTGNLELIQLLLDRGAKINASPDQEYNLLYSAVYCPNPEVLPMLLKAGVSVNAHGKNGQTALHVALASKMEMAKLLIEKGADINARDNDGLTPVFKIQFSELSEKIYRETLDYLLAHGVDLNVRTVAGNTLLHQLVADHQTVLFVNAIPVLLEKGLDPNLKNAHGDLPLHLALLDPSISAAALKALIEKTDLSVPGAQGMTPLLLALQRHLPSARDLIVARRTPGNLIESFFDAAAQNDTAKLSAMIAKDHWLVQARLPDGSTALHMAALWSALDSTKLLIESGSNIEARDCHSRTPLHRAVHWETNKQKRPDVVYTIKALLARHADAAASDDEMSTPLHLAAKQGLLDVVETLVDAQTAVGISLDLRDKDGRTPLLNSLENRMADSAKIAQLLIEKGAGVSVRSKTGETPLIQAARTDQPTVLAALLAKGAALDEENSEGSPLGNAVSNGSKAAAQFLIEKGADVNRPTEYGYSLLERAIYRDWADLAQLLIAKGADVNARYSGDQTPLTRAVMRNKKDLVLLLLQKGADVNGANSGGQTPLQIAQTNGNVEIAGILKENGAKAQ